MGARSEVLTGIFGALTWILVVIGALLGAGYLGSRGAPIAGQLITEREPHEALEPLQAGHAGHPYRALLRRAARTTASPVSGLKTALLVFLAMALVTLSLPRLLDLPQVVEFEVVLAAFWLLWGLVGSYLLFRGFRIAADHILATPRAPWRFLDDEGLADSRRWVPDVGCRGCGTDAVPALAILALTFLACWAFVEVLLPLVLFLVYFVIRTALAQVANDVHDCQGHPGRALGWGFAWSTLYVLPLAAALAMIHWLGG